MRQHETLGKMLRKDYIDGLGFLTNQYTDKSIEAYSTEMNRTMQSITSQLYGLYPSGYGPKKVNVPKQYNILPFSMDQDAPQEVFALPEGYLPFIVKIDDSVLITQCQNNKVQYQSSKNYVRPNELKILTIFCIIHHLWTFTKQVRWMEQKTVDKNLGRPMPAGFTQNDALNLKHLHYWYKYFKLMNSDLEQVFNTGKIKRIISDFDGRINNPQQQLKWTFFSARDTDIAAMLLNLNVSSPQCIEQIYTTGKTSALNCSSDQEYASNIIFQLHFQKSEYLIKVRHDGVYVNLCQRKSLSCPYEEWKSRVNGTILNNINSVCKKNRQRQSEKILIAIQL